MEVGDKLNPQRSYRKGFALKGLRQHIIKMNNPSTIGPDELLTVMFPDLKENQVIIPGTTKLTFNITLVGTDVNRIKINKLSTTDNILNSKPCDVLYTGYLNKDISFGDIIYFEPKNVQYKKLAIGTIGQLKVSLINGDGNEIFGNFKISIVLHIV